MAEYINGEEFGRWLKEQGDFRARLETRIRDQHVEVVGHLTRIEAQVRETNGRTTGLEVKMGAFDVRLQTIEAEDREIDKVVHNIQKDGCNQMKAHAEILGWSPQKKAAVSGGLIASGAIIVTAFRDGATAIHRVIEFFAPLK
jgi:hypothetical protein